MKEEVEKSAEMFGEDFKQSYARAREEREFYRLSINCKSQILHTHWSLLYFRNEKTLRFGKENPLILYRCAMRRGFIKFDLLNGRSPNTNWIDCFSKRQLYVLLSGWDSKTLSESVWKMLFLRDLWSKKSVPNNKNLTIRKFRALKFGSKGLIHMHTKTMKGINFVEDSFWGISYDIWECFTNSNKKKDYFTYVLHIYKKL